MKVITLWQPWASLIVEGKKHIETRSWATSYRGPIGIHAAQKPYIDGIALMSIETMEYLREALDLLAISRESDWTAYNKALPCGAVIGYANLIDCIQITEKYSEFVKCMTPKEYAFGDFTLGRYAWIMDDPVKFIGPIPAKGMQRLWEHDIPMKEVIECRD